jgi:hypothetical protein
MQKDDRNSPVEARPAWRLLGEARQPPVPERSRAAEPAWGPAGESFLERAGLGEVSYRRWDEIFRLPEHGREIRDSAAKRVYNGSLDELLDPLKCRR